MQGRGGRAQRASLSSRSASASFPGLVGASSRFICDLSTPEEGWFAHNSGPSGDIASPFFANRSPTCHRFEYFRSALWPADQLPEKVEHVVVGCAHDAI